MAYSELIALSFSHFILSVSGPRTRTVRALVLASTLFGKSRARNRLRSREASEAHLSSSWKAETAAEASQEASVEELKNDLKIASICLFQLFNMVYLFGR